LAARAASAFKRSSWQPRTAPHRRSRTPSSSSTSISRSSARSPRALPSTRRKFGRNTTLSPKRPITASGQRS
jgi:hypothetical protein